MLKLTEIGNEAESRIKRNKSQRFSDRRIPGESNIERRRQNP